MFYFTVATSVVERATMAQVNVTNTSTSSGAISSGDRQRELHGYMWSIGVWELVISLVGTPTNALVLYLALRLARNGVGSVGGKQQWFVASMTAADLLFTAVHSPMCFALYTLAWRFDGPLCSLFYMATHVSVVSSSLSLLLINADKFLALRRPLHYPSLMTGRRAACLLLGSWAVSFGWASFLVFGPFLEVRSNCGPIFKPQYKALYYAFAVLFFALPVCVSVGMAVFATSLARRARTRNLPSPSSSRRRDGSQHQQNGAATAMLDGARRVRRKDRLAGVRTVAFVASTTCWSAVTLLPYRFAFVLNLLGYTSLIMQAVFLTMTTMNALGNPFITLATQYRYRKEVRRLWRKALRRPTLADNPLLSEQVASAIRSLCMQHEQLITAASRRSAVKARRTTSDGPVML